MPKISSLNVKSVIIKFIVKSLALTTTSIILISSVASFIIFKLDLDLSYCKYAGYLISALTSFIVPFICFVVIIIYGHRTCARVKKIKAARK